VTLLGVSTDLDGLIANAAIDGIGLAGPASVTGTAGSDTLAAGATSVLVQGLAGNDSLSGGVGLDTLDGGTGTDTLAGGLGSDTYIIDNAKDALDEAGGDDDRIQASITIDLQNVAYDGIEHATLTGTGALNATGDELSNMLVGSAGANKLDGKAGTDTMIGGAGNDTYEVDELGEDDLIEFAGEGTDQVNSAGGFRLPAFVENLTLTGGADSFGLGNDLANKVTGNSGANSLMGLLANDTLTGNDGNDTLNGGAGADSLTGGKGSDVYVIDDIGDKLAESGLATDVDRVESTITYTLGTTIENLTLLDFADIDGTGNSFGNAITGNDGNNVLNGLAGNDTLAGSFREDTLIGGAGSDVFSFDLASIGDVDVVADFSGLPNTDKIDLEDILDGVTQANADEFLKLVTANGNTTVQVDLDGGVDDFFDLAVLQGVSMDLDGLIANAAVSGLGALVATPTTGTAGADTLAAAATSTLVQGLAGSDSLSGGAGFDTLDGGTGSDTLSGGAGSDTYIVDAVGDKLADSGGADDRIQASITIDLQNVAYAGIEHVTLSGTAALNATGDEFANMLVGKGESDTMIGGAGNDTYEVDDDDLIVENPGEGTDQVNSAAGAHTLSDNVENLALTGAAAVFGGGNALANKITGNTGNNNLEGLDGNDTLTGNDGDDDLNGGLGADSMVGGKGSDDYFVDNVGDKISETGPATDVDQVFTYTLGSTLERLFLSGGEAIDGTGNALANLITGGSGDNVLSGLGGNDVLDGREGDDLLLGGDGADQLVAGKGADTLLGGGGNDEFLFLADSLDGRETIADLSLTPGGDRVNIADLLDGFDADSSNINDFLQTAATSTGTIIRVDGSGGDDSFVDAVLLEGVNTDLMGLLNNGTLVLA
jgi:Ca2+-binding RTX toxin-like protein